VVTYIFELSQEITFTTWCRCK